LPQGDGGSLLPLILVFVLVVIMMIMGTTAATSAFIAQRDLQSDCDADAMWAASEADANDLYHDAASSKKYLPLSPEAVAAAVEEHRKRFYADRPELRMRADSDGEQLVVKCHDKVKVPFGAFFGKGGGVDRDAESAVRSPVSIPPPSAHVVDN
jgi:hypothetical protein